jgi:DNA-binding NtrC family response regulator/pSer/pThr/pTyr-binding forkhead associated (FHA) protein
MSKLEDKTTIDHDFSGSAALGRMTEPHVALVVFHPDGVKVVPMQEDVPTVVGRAWPADVVVPDLSLSRKHAVLTWREDGVEVEDLGSTNGTRVQGDRITKARVLPGETIQLGGVTVSVNVASGTSSLRGIDMYARFLRRVEEEVVRSRTFTRRMALLFIRALRLEDGHVARWVPRLRAQLREVDHLTLYGQGAVLVMLPETEYEDAARVAEALVSGNRLGEPTLVCGLAVFPEAGSSEELIDAARQAARRAKPSSRVAIARRADTVAASDRKVIVQSPRMQELWELVRRVAAAAIPVLIHGETGSGKEIVARAIHDASTRKDKPMRSLNCGAIPATLIESVLFGHEKGAFTGAERSAPGLFEQADGGTVFLDEVGELSAAAQAALLRVLETKRLSRVGAAAEIDVDVRVLGATHRDLDAMVASGDFRQDLLFRLNAMTLHVPPLRERPEDVEPLAEQFLAEAARDNATVVRDLDPEARRLLRTYVWPGNVRELRNEIERATVVCSGDIITAEDLSERVRGTAGPVGDTGPTVPPQSDSDFKDRVKQYEIELILDALRRAEGNQTQAAKLLRMPLRTLVHKIKSYGIKKMYDA